MNTTFVKKGTSLQWIRLLVEKVQVCGEYDFCVKGNKFAVNTTFDWKVQVCGEYDFSLKGTEFEMNTTFD